MSAYGNSLIATQIPLYNKAKEGSYAVSIDILWNSYPVSATALKTVDIDVRNALGTVPISQIGVLWIDNSKCDSNLEVILPDTLQVITVVPKSSRFYPIMSSNTKFTVNLITAPTVSNPETKIIAINEFMPPSETETTVVIQNTSLHVDFNGVAQPVLFQAPQHVIVDSAAAIAFAAPQHVIVDSAAAISFAAPQHVIVDSAAAISFAAPQHVIVDTIPAISFTAPQHVIVDNTPPMFTSAWTIFIPNPGAAAIIQNLFLGTGIIYGVEIDVRAVNVTVGNTFLTVWIEDLVSSIFMFYREVELYIAALPNATSDQKLIQLSGLNIATTNGARIRMQVAANGGGISGGNIHGNLYYHSP